MLVAGRKLSVTQMARTGVHDLVVKALNLRSRVLVFDSRSPGHVSKPWASFESTLPLATKPYWVPREMNIGRPTV